MLRIEKVFLQGFKSFCDPTEVIFDSEGITAVVGPNGCGKSNVADALNWVIGEQRAKALRGGKMEDVIFQGSRNRKPSGLAEVSLTMRVAESFILRPQEAPSSKTDDTVPTQPTEDIPIEMHPHSLASRRGATKQSFAEGEKITISRRLYRTGESEYEMNGRGCRLRDILDLFAGTGLGSAHYAIIEQGRIGQILSAKPLDRRALIEEAAGISKFKLRQRAAEVKLEAAKQNLSRLTDIIIEVERQQGTLKRQAAKARRYQRLRNEYRALIQAVLAGDYQKTQYSISELETQRTEISQQELECGNNLQAAEARRQEHNTQATELDKTLTDARAATAATNLEVEKIRQQQMHLKSRIETLIKRLQQLNQDTQGINDRHALIAQESEKSRAELRGIESEINEEALTLSEVEKLHLEKYAEDQQRELQLESHQRHVTEAATHREKWHQVVRQYTEALDRCGQRMTGLSLEELRAKEQAQKITSDHVLLRGQISQIETEEQRVRQEFEEIQIKLRQRRLEAHEATQSLLNLQKETTITEQRLKSLIELRERHAYYSEPVQALMQEIKQHTENRKFSILGTLADFINISPEDEALVEVGLREELQYLITPTFEDALAAIEFLKQTGLGRATFLVLSPFPLAPSANGKYTDHPTEGTILRLIDMLGLKPEVALIIRRALPRLSHTIIAEQVHQAIQASITTNGKGNSYLTTSGEFISAGHVISGGSISEKGTSILALKREISDLQILFANTTKEKLEAEKARQSIEAEIAQLVETEYRLDQNQRTIEKELVRQRGVLQQYERDEERAITHLRVVGMDIHQTQVDHLDLTDRLRHATTQLNKADNSLREAEEQAAALLSTINNVRLASSQRIQDISSRRADFAAKSERRKGLQNNLRRLEQEKDDFLRRLNRVTLDTAEAKGEIQAHQENLVQLDDDLQTQLHVYHSQQAETEQLNDHLLKQREHLSQTELDISELRTTLTQWRERRAQIDISHTRLTSHLEHLQTACQTELGVDLNVLVTQSLSPSKEGVETGGNEKAHTPPLESGEDLDDEPEEQFEQRFADVMPEDFDLEKAKRYLEELRAKIESIGPVNLLALQELGELDDRLTFLLTQRSDIEQAIADTITVITELKRRSRERFVDAFREINQNFSSLFLELFGGGHAEMRLIDESDVLESGIDIIAQPPGKRLQNVLLLSGGEKAMAALSLVMGIFKYRPSPFCILDEVDAPLDDVNISRFADKILEMSRNTQFLVITHSKRTMEAARTLYGVTMQDPGVSKLISVRLA